MMQFQHLGGYGTTNNRKQISMLFSISPSCEREKILDTKNRKPYHWNNWKAWNYSKAIVMTTVRTLTLIEMSENIKKMVPKFGTSKRCQICSIFGVMTPIVSWNMGSLVEQYISNIFFSHIRLGHPNGQWLEN